MRGQGCNYAILGLEPGADSAAIDRAYKDLIKRHHPDRDGGDARRAAEINRAYGELRGRRSLPDPLLIHDEVTKRAGDGWVRACFALVALFSVLLLASGPVTAWIQAQTETVAKPITGLSAVAAAEDPMDGPVENSTVEEAVRTAVSMSRKQDEAALLNASRDCHRTLRLEPSLSQLDRCAAFDDAVVELQDRDPTWDGGPFSQPAVTRRQWAAASVLSNDYLAVDGRLDRIRLHVELALAPRAAVPPESTANEATTVTANAEPTD